MKLIAHKGNIDGPNTVTENHPEQIDKCINAGYDVEVDLWWDNAGFKMPLDIVYSAFDGPREKRLDLNNSPKRIVIPEGSTLSLDPDKNILFEVLELN